jgi:hypothetical protein
MLCDELLLTELSVVRLVAGPPEVLGSDVFTL